MDHGPLGPLARSQKMLNFLKNIIFLITTMVMPISIAIFSAYMHLILNRIPYSESAVSRLIETGG